MTSNSTKYLTDNRFEFESHILFQKRL